MLKRVTRAEAKAKENKADSASAAAGDTSAVIEKESHADSDEDATLEEDLIKRLLAVVKQRDEIINCLESDRLRERQEDRSIADHITKYHEKQKDGGTEEDGKEVKKKKKLPKFLKMKKKDKEKSVSTDADKDVDEVEQKEKESAAAKKKLKWFK